MCWWCYRSARIYPLVVPISSFQLNSIDEQQAPLLNDTTDESSWSGAAQSSSARTVPTSFAFWLNTGDVTSNPNANFMRSTYAATCRAHLSRSITRCPRACRGIPLLISSLPFAVVCSAALMFYTCVRMLAVVPSLLCFGRRDFSLDSMPLTTLDLNSGFCSCSSSRWRLQHCTNGDKQRGFSSAHTECQSSTDEWDSSSIDKTQTEHHDAIDSYRCHGICIPQFTLIAIQSPTPSPHATCEFNANARRHIFQRSKGKTDCDSKGDSNGDVRFLACSFSSCHSSSFR